MKDNGQDIPEWFEKMYSSGYSGVPSKNDSNFLGKKRGPEQPFIPFFNNSQIGILRNPQQGFNFNYSNPNINNTQQGFQPRVTPQEDKKQDFGKYDFFQDHYNTDKNKPSNFDDKPRNDHRDTARSTDSDKYKPGGFDDYRSRIDNTYRPNNTYDRHSVNYRRDSERDHRHNDSRSHSDRSKQNERRRDDSRDRDHRHRRDDREYDRHRDSKDSGSRHSSRSRRDDRDERRYDDRDRREERKFEDRNRREESRNDWRSGYFSTNYPDSVSLKKPRFDN
jgi:hypothetical protein